MSAGGTHVEINEVVALDAMTTNKDENYCDGKDPDPKKFKCRIANLAGAAPTASRLLKNMKRVKMPVPKKPSPGRMGAGWDIAKCSRNVYPFQTHHLIPKKHLPTHRVCTWLAKSYTENPKFQLLNDNNYDTDHANNGYCMPFVSGTLQWKQAGDNKIKQQKAACQMMKKTGIQLHQGSHSYEGFGGEDEGVESKGYLQAVDELLSRINRGCKRHVQKCNVCKKSDAKPNIMPVEGVVRQMDQASRVMKFWIDSNKVFVSKLAYHCS
jgi:hypothetical protein